MPVHCSLNPDRMMYFVLCGYRDGPAWAERDISRTNKRDTLEDICNGALPKVVQVIELNFIEHTSRDVTDDFALAIEQPSFVREAADRLAAMRDHEQDCRKHSVSVFGW
jgi:hypothetical protein